MTRLWLGARALRALWRVGLLRLWPHLWPRVWLAWRRCRGSLAFLAEVAAIRAGARPALVDDDGPLTFADLRDRYRALAATLIDCQGAGPGRQVAILARNHRSLVVALLAAVRTGADVVLLNPDSPPRVLADLLAAGAGPARGSTAGATTPAGGPSTTILLHAAEVDIAGVAPDAPRMVIDAAASAAAPARPLPRLGRPGQLMVLTAGSTGLPKRIGRRPTLAALLPTVLGLLEALPMRMHQPTICAVPCFHGHGLATLATALAFAAPVHLARRYEIAPLLVRAPMAGPPFIVSVPTLLGRWLAAGEVTVKIAAVLSGSAPLAPRLCRDLLAAVGPVVYNLYGSTEAGVVALATPAMVAAAPGTVGRPLPGVAIRVVATDGSEVLAGQRGAICVRGPLVARPDATGWLATGDLGNFDEAGRLHVAGRTDGMFISGGENVYPQVVEAALRDHPEVSEAAIVVVPDVEFGARMRALVVIHAGATLTAATLGAWLRDRLDRHQQPKTIAVVPALPRNSLGKLDRSALPQLLPIDAEDPRPRPGGDPG